MKRIRHVVQQPVGRVLRQAHDVVLGQHGGRPVGQDALGEHAHLAHARLVVPAADGRHVAALRDVDEPELGQDPGQRLHEAEGPAVDGGEGPVDEAEELEQGVVGRDGVVVRVDVGDNVVDLYPAAGLEVSVTVRAGQSRSALVRRRERFPGVGCVRTEKTSRGAFADLVAC